MISCKMMLIISFQSSESFTDVVRIDDEAFKCSFQLVYSEAQLSLSPGRSNIWCGTETVARARKLFLLAPSGYRFSLLIDLNPTRIKKARVSGKKLGDKSGV